MSIKYRGMLFKEWCEVNGYEYMISELDEEYSYSNYQLNLSNLTHGNDKKLKWVCSKGHTFYAKTVHRTNGQREVCEYCSGSRLSLSEHSVSKDLENLLPEWDYERNTVSPDEITSSYTGKVYWICSNGHSYRSAPHHRKDGRGCPYCANKKVLKGYNDFATTHAYLLDEWDYNGNDISPEDITYGYNKVVNWVCKFCGNRYSLTPLYKTQGRGCPLCSKGSSYPEKLLGSFLSKHFYIERRKKLFGFEYDIYIPEINTVIEYNGSHWHEGKEDRDKEKYDCAINNALRMIVINSVRDKAIFESKIDTELCYLRCFIESVTKSSLLRMLKWVAEVVQIYDIIDVDTEIKDAEKYVVGTRRETDVSDDVLELMKPYFDINENDVDIQHIRGSETYKFRCKNGHPFIRSVRYIQLKGVLECPYCKGYKFDDTVCLGRYSSFYCVLDLGSHEIGLLDYTTVCKIMYKSMIMGISIVNDEIIVSNTVSNLSEGRFIRRLRG